MCRSPYGCPLRFGHRPATTSSQSTERLAVYSDRRSLASDCREIQCRYVGIGSNSCDLSPDTGTSTLCRIIDEGPSNADLAFLGGVINTGASLSGVTGFRSGTEVAFMGGAYDGKTYAGIIGQPRYVGLYNTATGNGTSASFVITKFVMVRVVFASLDTNPKGIVIQPVQKSESMERVWLAK